MPVTLPPEFQAVLVQKLRAAKETGRREVLDALKAVGSANGRVTFADDTPVPSPPPPVSDPPTPTPAADGLTAAFVALLDLLIEARQAGDADRADRLQDEFAALADEFTVLAWDEPGDTSARRQVLELRHGRRFPVGA